MTVAHRPRHRFTIVLAVAVALAAVACGGGSGAAPGAPAAGSGTVILISIEGLRADHLGCYGSTRATSPAIDALAAEGARFEWAFTQAPEGAAATASLLTGLYPTTHGVVDPGDSLVAEVPTLAGAFQAAGYEVGFFADGGSALATPGLTTGILNDVSAATTWLRNKAGGPLLMVVGLSSPLPPFAPTDDFTAGLEAPPDGFVADRESLASSELDEAGLAWARALYDGEVRAADAVVGEIVAAVTELGLGDGATVVVAGAHGLDLGEHGMLGETLASPVTRVPLVVRRPGGVGAGVVSKIVELVDVMPTLLELAGVAAPDGVQGASLLPVMSDDSQPPYIAFAEAANGARMAALGGYQMLVDGDATTFFDLAADPFALTDLAPGEERRVGVLTSHLDAWGKMVAAVSYDPARKGEELDEDTLDNLRSLGYIQ